MDSSDDEDDHEALCIDLGTLRWRVGLCGDDAPKFVLLTCVTAENVTAHPLASTFGMAEPDLAGTEPKHLVNQLLAMAIADEPEARQYLWDLQCQGRRSGPEMGMPFIPRHFCDRQCNSSWRSWMW